MNEYQKMPEWVAKINPLLAEDKFEEANKITQNYYSSLEDPKDESKFGFLLIANLIKTNFKYKQYKEALKWCDELLKFNLSKMDKYDDGEREFYTGATYYELGDFEKAKEFLILANKKSKGRSLKLFDDMKYSNFLKEK